MARFTRVFGMPELRVRFVRSLRFRLLLSYVLFFTLLLVGIGLLFRQLLNSQLLSEVQTALEQQWDEARGYFDIENEEPVWSKLPDDAQVVSELQQMYLIADANGNYLGYNEDTLDAINFDAKDIQRIVSQSQPEAPEVRQDKNKESYLVKAGRVLEVDKNDRKQWYFLAIGRPLRSVQNTVDNFTKTYFYALLGLIPMSSIFGWVVAGRALRPLNSVAQAAQNITGSNLSLQIPLRGAGDELDHLIESFNRMTARLNQSFEQIRRFSTDVSHELRTPLTAIRGQLEVALFTAETPDQYRDAMVNALEDVEKLSSIVRALLLLSQAESGQLVLQKVALDAGEAVLDFVDQFQIPAQEKNITLTANAVPGSVIPADRTQFERLLSNLLSNAIKYTPNGGSVNVRVGPSDSPTFVCLEVQDTGVGIPAENLPHIFDRFYRVRNPATHQTYGLGLGLSFVSWIVEAHGGRIDVASTVGEGTRFRILLPRNIETPHTAPAETAAAPLH